MKDFFKVREAAVNINNNLLVARPGLIFILIASLIFLFSLVLENPFLSLFFLILLAFVTWFFRDPERSCKLEGIAVAPADGKIIVIEDLESNPYTDAPAKKISIFMNVFNVHVNRIPLPGVLLEQKYFPGKFFNADLDKASEHNERNALIIDSKYGKVAMVQIAGLIARRIVSWVNEGDDLAQGQRFGMIRFGSRVDLYLPPNAEVLVSMGQKVHAGQSPIWRLPEN